MKDQILLFTKNRRIRTYTDTWDNFQGFYLALDLGTPVTWRDLYLRSEGENGDHRTKGFIIVINWQGEVHITRFKAYEKALNFGFFRWPQRWDRALIAPTTPFFLYEHSFCTFGRITY